MSGMNRALAFMTGFGTGYINTGRQQEQDAERKQDREFKRREQQRTQSQWDREDQLRNDLASASEPVAVKQVAEPGQLTVGPDGPMLAEKPEFRAAGQNYPDQASATAAAGQATARSARMERTAAAYDRAGMPDKAEGYRTLAKQAREEGVLDLIDQIRGSAPAMDDVRGTKAGFVSHDIPAEALKAYDGTGKWRVAPGTKVQSYLSKNAYGDDVLDHRLVRPDGTVVLDSLNTASRFVGMDPSQRAGAEDRQAATRYTVGKDARDTDFRHTDADRNYELRKTEVADKGLLRAAQAEAAAVRAQAAAAAAANKNAQGALTLADLKDGFKSIATTLNADYKAQIDNALTPEAADPLKRKRETETANVQRLYQGAIQTGMTLTPEQAIAAYRQGKQGVATVTLTDGSKAQVQGVQVGNRFIPMSNDVGREMPAAPAAPAQAPKPSAQQPRVVAKMGGGPGQQPAAAPAGPSAQETLAALEQRLAVDDRIKSSFEGAGGRMMQERALPLGLAERKDMEREVARLRASQQ